MWEDKWNNQNGIVLLLPHGYEGQGAELVRKNGALFTTLCKTKYVCCWLYNALTSFTCWEGKWKRSSVSHLLCLHLRVCCVIHDVFLLLKNSKTEVFKTIDDDAVNKADVKTLVFCTGKFYWAYRRKRENERKDVAIVRIEQLFPLPIAQLKEIIAKYQMLTITSGRKKSQNMGAYIAC
jgi:2-oxoglutarate dehydrogenase E1 component